MVCEPVFRTAVYQMFQKSGQKNPIARKGARIWMWISHPNLKQLDNDLTLEAQSFTFLLKFVTGLSVSDF